MEFQNSLQLLRTMDIGGHIRHEKTLTSSVTTDWQVHWNEDFIARDLLQNFYDANRDNVAGIRVLVDGSRVTIAAPKGYNLERLFYLGSEKQSSDVGHYGEGFKAAATCLLDFRVTPVAMSDNQIAVLQISDEPVAGTDLYPLVYDFFTTDVPWIGILSDSYCCSSTATGWTADWASPISFTKKTPCWANCCGHLPAANSLCMPPPGSRRAACFIVISGVESYHICLSCLSSTGNTSRSRSRSPMIETGISSARS